MKRQKNIRYLFLLIIVFMSQYSMSQDIEFNREYAVKKFHQCMCLEAVHGYSLSYYKNGPSIKQKISELKSQKLYASEINKKSEILNDYIILKCDSSSIIDYSTTTPYVVAVNKKTGSVFRLQGFIIDDTMSFLLDVKEDINESIKWVASNCNIDGIDIFCRYRLLTGQDSLINSYWEKRINTCLRKARDYERVIVH